MSVGLPQNLAQEQAAAFFAGRGEELLQRPPFHDRPASMKINSSAALRTKPVSAG